MAVRELAAAVWRNRMVALALAIACGLVAVRVLTAPPLYQARTVVTFLSPGTSFPRNAYASFTPDLTAMAEVAVRAMGDERSRRAVRQAGGTADYEIVLANRGNQEMPIHDQPYATVLATANDPRLAARTLTAVIRVLRDQLADRQVREGASQSSLISGRLTAQTNEAAPQYGQPTRSLAAIAILGVIGVVYGALLADRFRSRRAGRARSQSPRPEVP